MKESYQLVLIINVSLAEEARKKLLDGIKKQIEDFGGKVTKEEEMGKRVLAYKIKKEKEGYYFVLEFMFPPEKIKTLREKIKGNIEVLRYLFLRKE